MSRAPEVLFWQRPAYHIGVMYRHQRVGRPLGGCSGANPFEHDAPPRPPCPTAPEGIPHRRARRRHFRQTLLADGSGPDNAIARGIAMAASSAMYRAEFERQARSEPIEPPASLEATRIDIE